MSEPTPLSAERPYSRDELVHLAENMRHSTVQQIVGATEQKTINRLLATIDAQATEIAALKGALAELREYTVDRESIANVMHIRGYGKPPDVTALRERIDALIGPYKARVLAGKEAQR